MELKQAKEYFGQVVRVLDEDINADYGVLLGYCDDENPLRVTHKVPTQPFEFPYRVVLKGFVASYKANGRQVMRSVYRQAAIRDFRPVCPDCRSDMLDSCLCPKCDAAVLNDIDCLIGQTV